MRLIEIAGEYINPEHIIHVFAYHDSNVAINLIDDNQVIVINESAEAVAKEIRRLTEGNTYCADDVLKDPEKD